MRDPQDPKRHLVPDPESSEIVKLIFALCVGGKGPNQIAKELEKRGILSPGHYAYQRQGIKNGNLNLDKPYKWHSENIVRILENEVYLGYTISLVNTTKSYKNKKRVVRLKEDQVRTENTHEPLVEKKIWDIVQKFRESKAKTAPLDEPNIFVGMMYCADCGGKLDLFRSRTKGNNYNNFKCRNYNRNGKEACSAHYINEDTIRTMVLDDLRRVPHIARTHSDLFGRYLKNKSNAEVQKEINKLTKDIDILKKRDVELCSLFKRLYEDNVLGKIPNEVFRNLSDDYLAEQKEVQATIPMKENELEKLKSSVTNIDNFIEKAKQYPEIPELTSEILHLFISKIIVSEKEERYSRTTPQKAKIVYREI